MALEVLTTPRCRWAIRVIATLLHKRLSFQVTNVQTPDGKVASFASRTPFGMTPVLVHGERSLPESSIILEYIDEIWPAPALRSGDSLGRAWERVWMRHCDQELIPALTQLVRSTGDDSRQASLARLTRGMALLETARHNNRPEYRFWHGPDAGLLDYCYCTFFHALDHAGGESATDLLHEFPALAAWDEAIRGHGGLQRAEAMLHEI